MDWADEVIAFHVSRGDVTQVAHEGLRVSRSADGRVYCSADLNQARVWANTLPSAAGISLWRVDLTGYVTAGGVMRSLSVDRDVPPDRLTLLGVDEDIPWTTLDPTALGTSTWHKEKPDEFWHRMRELHGEDVGPQG